MSLIERFQKIQNIKDPELKKKEMQNWVGACHMGGGRSGDWHPRCLLEDDVVLFDSEGHRFVQHADSFSFEILGEGKQPYYPRP